MKIERSESIKELSKALVAFQGDVENATKGSTNPAFKSKYADLAEILNTIRQPLHKHGLAVTQHPSYENGAVHIDTLLLHESGEFLYSCTVIPVTKQDAQGAGSAITYGRRYSLAAILGISQEDDDGNGSIGTQKYRKVEQRLPPLAPAQEEEVFEWTEEQRQNAYTYLDITYSLVDEQKFNEVAAKVKGDIAAGENPYKVLNRLLAFNDRAAAKKAKADA